MVVTDGCINAYILLNFNRKIKLLVNLDIEINKMGVIITSCCEKQFSGTEKKIEIETSYVRTESARRILSFKDFKGFKKVNDIADYYKFGSRLGQGSFGEVLKAEHKKANVTCAIKIIKKQKI